MMHDESVLNKIKTIALALSGTFRHFLFQVFCDLRQFIHRFSRVQGLRDTEFNIEVVRP